MSERDDGGEGASGQAGEGSAEPTNGLESLTSAFQEPVSSPLDDLPPASFWPDGALPPRSANEQTFEPVAYEPVPNETVPEANVSTGSWVAAPNERQPMVRQEPWLQEPPPHLSPEAVPPEGGSESPPYVGSFPAPRVPVQTRSRSGLWWTLGIVSAIVLLLGGCGYLLFRNLAQPAIDQANEMMADVVDADFAAAAQKTSSDADCFGGQAEAGLSELFSPNPADGYDFKQVRVNQTGSEPALAFVEGTINFLPGGENFAQGGLRPARVILIDVDGAWEVCGIFVE